MEKAIYNEIDTPATRRYGEVFCRRQSEQQPAIPAYTEFNGGVVVSSLLPPPQRNKPLKRDTV